MNMNRGFRFVLLQSVLAFSSLSGCNSDVGSERVEPIDPCPDACRLDDMKCDGDAVYICGKASDADDVCNSWIVKETCSGGEHCDASSLACVEGCAETCDENASKRCSTNGLEACSADEYGCASWAVVDACENGKCDPDSLKCVKGDPVDPGGDIVDECPNACDPEKDTMHCDGDDLYACRKNEGAEVECFTWTLEETCGNGQHCDDTSLKCTDGCAEICEENQKTRCSVDGIEQCQSDEKGCAVWSVVDPCEGGTCDPGTLKCVKNCSDQCAQGQRKCSGNGISSCTADENGCLIWGASTPCGSGTSCNPSNTQCEAQCNSDCTENGKKENGLTSQRVCTDVNGKGCLQWVQTDCAPGERFDAAQNKCVSVCGNDCAPFRIVFIPDSQEYTRRIEKVDGKIVKQKEDSSGNVKSTGTRSIHIFPDQLKWIHDYKDKYNIKAVIHLGDLTDTNVGIAWELNNNTYSTYLDDLNLPYTVAPGNHDYKQCTSNSASVDIDASKDCVGSNGSTYSRSASKFASTGNFNKSRAKVKSKAWFKEYATDTKVKDGNSFITFKAANIDFLVIALEYAPRNSVITWANDVIKAHPNHKVIIATHSYLSPTKKNEKGEVVTSCDSVPTKNAKGQFTTHYSGVSADALKGFNNDANGGKDMFDKLVAKHNNIILVANGHVAGSCFRLNKGNHDNTVAEMVVDYQTEDGIYSKCGHTHAHGGSGTGWFRMLEFDPKNLTITSITTSSLGGKRFGSKAVNGENANGKEWFYCKNLYPQDPKAKPSYRLDVKNDAHRFTNYHSFVVNFDFVTPVVYQ